MSSLKRKATDVDVDTDYEIKRRQIEYACEESISSSVTPESDIDNDDKSENAAYSTRETSPTQSATTIASSRSRPKNYFCDFPGCDKAYNRPVRLAEHQRSHTGERPFVCDHDGCTKTFTKRSHLKHHLNTQHDHIRNFVCDWPGCDKSYPTGQRLRVHQTKAHDDQKEDYVCTGFPPCEQVFRKADTLQRHITSVHLFDKPYTCDAVIDQVVCARKFKTAYSLQQHQDREHSGDRFWCAQCPTPEHPQLGVGFATQKQLQAHVKQVHLPTCDECGIQTKTAGQLKAHRDIAHTSIDARRVFACDRTGCDRAFTSKGNLSIHVRSAHEARRFVCGEIDLSVATDKMPAWDGTGACGRGFSSKQSLVNHVRSEHLRLPAAATSAPGKAKRLARKMQRHGHGHTHGDSVASVLTGAGYEETRHLSCPMVPCAQRFKRRRDLEVHLEMTHAVDQDAAGEAVMEQVALHGGQFWVGDGGERDANDDEMSDLLFAAKLEEVLHADEAMNGL